MSFLISLNCDSEISAISSVDLSRGKPGTIQQDLCPGYSRSRSLRPDFCSVGSILNNFSTIDVNGGQCSIYRKLQQHCCGHRKKTAFPLHALVSCTLCAK